MPEQNPTRTTLEATLPTFPEQLANPEYYKDPVTFQLAAITEKTGIKLPDAKDVLTKFSFMTDGDFKKVVPEESGDKSFADPHDRTIGVATWNNKAFLNKDRITQISQDTGFTLEQIATAATTHEVFHLTEAKSMHRKQNDKTIYVRSRNGLFLNEVDEIRNDTIALGSRRLEEGVIEALRSSLLKDFLPPGLIRYPKETEIAKQLIEKVGDTPFLQALYQQDGISQLITAMNTSIGLDGFWNLLSAMGNDVFKRRTRVDGLEVIDYVATQTFIDRAENNAGNGI